MLFLRAAFQRRSHPARNIRQQPFSETCWRCDIRKRAADCAVKCLRLFERLPQVAGTGESDSSEMSQWLKYLLGPENA